MADYRLLWASIKAPSVILGELPVETISYSKVLNAPGAIGGRLPLDPYGPSRRTATIPIWPTTHYAPGTATGSSPFVTRTPTAIEARTVARDLFGPAAFGSARTVVYIDRDGVILKGGLVWGHQASVNADQLSFSGEGWHSYFRERTIQTTLTYTSTDQDTIARGLIDHAQSYGGGDIDILTTANTHGVTRDRGYPWHEAKNVGIALEQLAGVQDGFEFDYVSGYNSSGDIETNFVTRYPATGRHTEHVFELGVNCELVEYAEDGKVVRNQHRALGAGYGNEIESRTSFNSPLITTYPLLEGISNHPDVVRPATLTEHAERALQRGSKPAELVTMSVYPGSIPVLGSYELGDRVRVSADRGYIQYDADWFRIVAHQVDVSPGEGETSTIVLAPLELFV